MDAAEPHSPATVVHGTLVNDENDIENDFSLANESQLSLASQPSAVSSGKKPRGRKSNWQPVEILIAFLCRVFAQTEHGSRSKDDSRYLSAKNQYAFIARELKAFLDAANWPGHAWPQEVDVERSIRERTQRDSDLKGLTGEVLYKKGNNLKTYLKQHTAKFAVVYAAANGGRYIPSSGDNDGTVAWVAAERTVEANYNAQPRVSTNDGYGGNETKVSAALFEAGVLAFRLLCPQSPYNVAHSDVLKSYVAAAWNLDPSRRLDQQGEPTDQDMKKAAKAAQRAAVHSTYMAQSELNETLTSHLQEANAVLKMLVEQRAERQALHKLPQDSERDRDEEIERRVQERLAAQEAELESRIESRLLKRLESVHRAGHSDKPVRECVDFLTDVQSDVATSDDEKRKEDNDNAEHEKRKRAPSPIVDATPVLRTSKRKNAGVNANKRNK